MRVFFLLSNIVHLYISNNNFLSGFFFPLLLLFARSYGCVMTYVVSPLFLRYPPRLLSRNALWTRSACYSIVLFYLFIFFQRRDILFIRITNRLYSPLRAERPPIIKMLKQVFVAQQSDTQPTPLVTYQIFTHRF